MPSGPRPPAPGRGAGRRDPSGVAGPSSWPHRRWWPTPWAPRWGRWWPSSSSSSPRPPGSRPSWPTVLSSTPDAKIIRSLPALGTILGARVLGEFGDDPNRFADAKSRKNYAGTSPITRASGKHHVVLARYARNRRLNDATHQWAFSALTASPG